jgi:hypothetical protein
MSNVNKDVVSTQGKTQGGLADSADPSWIESWIVR